MRSERFLDNPISAYYSFHFHFQKSIGGFYCGLFECCDLSLLSRLLLLDLLLLYLMAMSGISMTVFGSISESNIISNSCLYALNLQKCQPVHQQSLV